MRDCLGLSVGATNLVAIADHAPLVRRAVLTVSAQRGPVVGAPSETTSPADGTVAITPAQLAYMLDGIDWRNPIRTWRPEAAG